MSAHSAADVSETDAELAFTTKLDAVEQYMESHTELQARLKQGFLELSKAMYVAGMYGMPAQDLSERAAGALVRHQSDDTLAVSVDQAELDRLLVRHGGSARRHVLQAQKRFVEALESAAAVANVIGQGKLQT